MHYDGMAVGFWGVWLWAVCAKQMSKFDQDQTEEWYLERFVAERFPSGEKNGGGGFFFAEEKILACQPAGHFTLTAAWRSQHPTRRFPQNVTGSCA
jgi:hypothetical protein